MENTPSVLLVMICCMFSLAFSTSVVEIYWEGGTSFCPASQCLEGLYCMPTYSCDSLPSWTNGTRHFLDPIPKSTINPVITRVTLTLSGVFGCGQSSSANNSSSSNSNNSSSSSNNSNSNYRRYNNNSNNSNKVFHNPQYYDDDRATVQVYMANAWFGSISVDRSSEEECKCKNCAPVYTYTRYLNGWKNYVYGGTNTIQVFSPDATACVCSVNAIFVFDSDTNPTTTSSDTSSGITMTSSTTDMTTSTSTTGLNTLTSSTSTTGNTSAVISTTTGDHNNPHGVIYMGTLMLAGLVCVNAIVIAGWYLWRRKALEEEEGGNSKKGGGGDGSRKKKRKGRRPPSMYDKAVTPLDIVLGERIGKGSFGEVYRAVWLQTEVAVKKLPSDILANPTLVEEFNVEVKLLRSMMHPNILQFMGSCLIPPDIFLVTEYIPRGDLYKIIHNNAFVLDWRLIRRIAIDVARGMAYLHGSNPVIIHRDLKSHNVLIGEHWNAKVADFGLCKIIRDSSARGRFTPCGTPKWAAPEVLRNEIYTTKADVYSFGIILWEMATRQDVFPGLSAFELIVQVGKNGLRPDMPPHVYGPLAALIRECWTNDPEMRPNFERVLLILESTL